MLKRRWAFGFVAVMAVPAALSGCGSQPKQQTVSVVDENHFDQLASMPAEGPGNAASGIEVLADGTVPPSAAAMAPSVPIEAANAPVAATRETASIGTASAPKRASFEEKVQTALKNAGYYSGVIDGKIGQKTREAIKSFQTASGLKADGVVGPGTWEKLKKYVGGASAGSGA